MVGGSRENRGNLLKPHNLRLPPTPTAHLSGRNTDPRTKTHPITTEGVGSASLNSAGSSRAGFVHGPQASAKGPTHGPCLRTPPIPKAIRNALPFRDSTPLLPTLASELDRYDTTHSHHRRRQQRHPGTTEVNAFWTFLGLAFQKGDLPFNVTRLILMEESV